MFLDIIDRKFNQCLEEIKELLSTLVLNFKRSASTGFQVLFIRLGIFSFGKWS